MQIIYFYNLISFCHNEKVNTHDARVFIIRETFP